MPVPALLLAIPLFMCSILALAMSLVFASSYYSVVLEWIIISLGASAITFPLILDWISLSFSGVVCLIAACVFIFTISYMAKEVFLSRFCWLVLLFVVSMNMLIFIPSLPSLLLGWDGLGIVSFALVIYYQNLKSLNAGMLTILMNRIGDVMILLAIALLVQQGHWLVVCMWGFESSWVVGLLVVVAAMTKSAQIPFSSWLPAAMAAPTPVSALVHSSTLVTAGVYLLVRFSPFLQSFSYYSTCLLFISVLTLMMAGLGANYENDLKKVIALSTLSQLGVMMLSLSIGAAGLTLFHLYTHALFKALLFLCAGSIIHTGGHTQDLRHSGLSCYQMPYTVVCMNIANLALCGAPFLSGFYSKDLILEFSLSMNCNTLMLYFILFATGLTAAYSFRLCFSSLWGLYNGSSYHSKGEDGSMVFSKSVLALLAVVSGVFFQGCFQPFSETCLLPVGLKLSPVLVVLAGIFFAFLIWDIASPKLDLEVYFLSTMWFLAPLSTQPLAQGGMLTSAVIMRSVDEGWLELLGPQGMSVVCTWASQQLQRATAVSIDVVISYILVGLVFALAV